MLTVTFLYFLSFRLLSRVSFFWFCSCHRVSRFWSADNLMRSARRPIGITRLRIRTSCSYSPNIVIYGHSGNQTDTGILHFTWRWDSTLQFTDAKSRPPEEVHWRLLSEVFFVEVNNSYNSWTFFFQSTSLSCCSKRASSVIMQETLYSPEQDRHCWKYWPARWTSETLEGTRPPFL